MSARSVALGLLGWVACGRVGFDASDGNGSGTTTGDGTQSDTPISAVNPCTTVPRLATLPEIDGILDPGLALYPVDWPPAQWIGHGDIALPDIRASYMLAWHAGGLYVFVDVPDPDLWPMPLDRQPYCGDAAELFVDSDGMYPDLPDYENVGVRQYVGRAPFDTQNTESSGAMYRQGAEVGAWTGAHVARWRPGGWTMEAFITSADLGLATWTLASGQRIGWDLGITLSAPDGDGPPFSSCDPGNQRIGQYFIGIDEGRTNCELPTCSVGAFCTPTLE